MTEERALELLFEASRRREHEIRFYSHTRDAKIKAATSTLKKAAHAWVKAQLAERVAKSIDAKKIGVKTKDRSHIHRKSKTALDTPSWMK